MTAVVDQREEIGVDAAPRDGDAHGRRRDEHGGNGGVQRPHDARHGHFSYFFRTLSPFLLNQP